jgi:general secretion pathway protein G
MGAYRTRRTGFTIVEILVVVIIIGVLAALIAPKFIGRIGAAKHSVAQQKVQEIEKAIEMFHYDYGRFPEAIEELVTRPDDVAEDKWQPPTVKSKDLLDPWGRAFVYSVPGDHDQSFDLYSLGADGQEGGEGENADVVNW